MWQIQKQPWMNGSSKMRGKNSKYIKSGFSEMITIRGKVTGRKSVEAITDVRTRKTAHRSVAVEVANKIEGIIR